MSGIFGVVDADSGAALTMSRMALVMEPWGRDRITVLADADARFGRALTFDTPEDISDRLPRLVVSRGVLLTAEARLDNREELLAGLAQSAQGRIDADGELLAHAYLRWGAACTGHCLGDWSFAAWHSSERKLLLARDHTGNTSLFYAQGRGRFAFASDIRALLQVDWVPRVLDDVALARGLVLWELGQESSTPYRHIRRLPPGHLLNWTSQGVAVSRYWSVDRTGEVTLSHDNAYADALRETLRTAVRCRLRSYLAVGGGLSGGLDSGAVMALAAEETSRDEGPITAFTSVPAVDGFPAAGPAEVSDESAGARMVVGRHPRLRHVLIRSRDMTPVQGVVCDQADCHVPGDGANLYWTISMLREARARGIGAFLTGQLGNLTFSWHGDPLSSIELFRRRRFRVVASRLTPRWLKVLKQAGWNPGSFSEPPWRRYSVINETVTRELRLHQGMRDAGHDPRWLGRPLCRASHFFYLAAFRVVS